MSTTAITLHDIAMMKYRRLGKSALKASVIGLGTWVTGGGSVWGSPPDDNESIDAIHAAIDAGINFIDTAPAYGWGHSEEVVGRAIKGRHDQVIIATKCGLWTDDDRGSFFTEFDGRIMRRSLRPDTIRIEVERSLARLGLECIDLYQIHWPSVPPDQTPIADTMACMLDLQEEGKIGAIGVSNVSLAELDEYRSNGLIVSDQFRYSMLHRQPERDIIPYCRKHSIATLAYMSLEQGLLTGKIGMNRVFGKNEFRSNAAWNPWLLPANRRRVLDMLAGWVEITQQYRCTLSQLVLAWTVAQPGVTHVLAGGRTVAQVLENTKAGAIDLNQSTLNQMRHDVEALGEPAV